MSKEHICNTILKFFRSKPILADIAEDEDFFDQGVSSLTVVELQILIEEELNIEIATAKLMTASTIKAWIELYCDQAS